MGQLKDIDFTFTISKEYSTHIIVCPQCNHIHSLALIHPLKYDYNGWKEKAIFWINSNNDVVIDNIIELSKVTCIDPLYILCNFHNISIKDGVTDIKCPSCLSFIKIVIKIDQNLFSSKNTYGNIFYNLLTAQKDMLLSLLHCVSYDSLLPEDKEILNLLKNK